MLTVIPYIPETITVHLGAPNEAAPNVRVPYLTYLQNVAASEIYPTWTPSAIRANLLAINSYALNRVYTEFYRSRGYAFDITNDTAFDQAFVNGRSTFENTDRYAQALVGTYIRRIGFLEPLAAKFCSGDTVTCDGLSQWGSQALGEEGKNSVEILRSYYGSNIELVSGAQVRPITPSYADPPLSVGSVGDRVTVVQTELNRIAQNYPAIPKVNPVDGYFGPQTREAVVAYQEIFDLLPDGIVGELTWYSLVRNYVAVTRLSELQSEGQTYASVSSAYPGTLQAGSESASVEKLQYMLNVVAAFNAEIPENSQSGIYDAGTEAAVQAYQEKYDLPPSGVIDEKTWDAITDSYDAIDREVFRDAAVFRFAPMPPADSSDLLRAQLSAVAAAFPSMMSPAAGEEGIRKSLAAWQRFCARKPTGRLDRESGEYLAEVCGALRYGKTTRTRQFGGKLFFGSRDQPPDDTMRMNPRIADEDQPVRNLQRMLRRLADCGWDLPHLTPDGIFDVSTERAVIAFERSAGLEADGIVDLAVWNALRRACDGGFERPRRFHALP